jgi:hypothetical protein
MKHPLQGALESRDGAWVLTMERDFAHPAEKVWPWLTDPDRLRQWSPVIPDRAFDSVGPRQVRENPGDEAVTGELTLEQTMRDRDRTAMNAAGSHICLDVLEGALGLRDRYVELLGV